MSHRPRFYAATPDEIEEGHAYRHDPAMDGPTGERYCWCGWDEEAHAPGFFDPPGAITTVGDLIARLQHEDPDRPVRIQTRPGRERRSISAVYPDPVDEKRLLIVGY